MRTPRRSSPAFWILTLIAALALVSGCKRDELEKQAPALARANLTVDRIAVAGVVSDVRSLPDSTASRANWSELIANHLGRERFGKLPIVPSEEVLAILGREGYGAMLDRFKASGQCDTATFAHLHTALEGKARFLVFGNILEDEIAHTESESEEPVSKDKILTKSSSRTTWVRLRFYDLADQKLVWDHRTVGIISTSKAKNMTDIIKHGKREGILASIATSIANSALKPEPEYPPTPELVRCLAQAFDNVGEYLKPRKAKR